jgi:hypothetical protein
MAVALRSEWPQPASETAKETAPIELSVVMPCLNESETLESCIRKAQHALKEASLAGEIIIADNGSRWCRGTLLELSRSWRERRQQPIICIEGYYSHESYLPWFAVYL